MRKSNRFILLIYLLVILTSVQSAFSFEQGEYLFECDFKDQIFLQDFTCFNRNCTDIMMPKTNKVLEASIGGKDGIIVTKPIIDLEKIYPNSNYVTRFCENKISSETIEVLREKTKKLLEKDEFEKAGEGLIFKPKTSLNIQSLRTEKENYEGKYETCYLLRLQTVENWIIVSREIKEYCEIVLNENSNEAQIKISYPKLLFYSIAKPSMATNWFLYTIIVTTAIIVLLIGIFVHHYEREKLSDILTINIEKIFISLIIMLPLSLIFSLLFDKLFPTSYEILVNFNLLITIVLYLISYLLASVVFSNLHIDNLFHLLKPSRSRIILTLILLVPIIFLSGYLLSKFFGPSSDILIVFKDFFTIIAIAIAYILSSIILNIVDYENRKIPKLKRKKRQY